MLQCHSAKSTEVIYHFGNTPILIASASFFFRPEDQNRFDSFEALPKGMRIGLINGYEYGNVYEENRSRFQEFRVNTQAQIISMLRLKRIDAAIMFDEVAKYTLAQNKLAPDVLSKGFMNHQSDIYVAFSRKRAHAEEYAQLLDEGLAIIKNNGDYERIFRGEID